MTEFGDRLAGAVWGHLVGDAVGVPYEFKPASAITSVHFGVSGTHGKPPGTWSDDGALMLALLDSLLRDRADGEARFDTADQAKRSLAWCDHGAYTPGGEGKFDIGGATTGALSRIRSGTPAEQAGGTGERDNGNGSLMRILPVALVDLDLDDAAFVDQAHRASAVTHGHPVSQAACALYVLAARELLGGSARSEAMDHARGRLRHAYHQRADAAERVAALDTVEAWTGRSGRGYVVDSLWSAWDALAGARDYREAIERAVRYGNDTDTTAAIAGGLAGIRFGLSGIPAHWLAKMRGRDIVDPLVARLTDAQAGATAAAATAPRQDPPVPPGARTSAMHPIYVNWVEPSSVPAAAGWTGRLGMSILAGKKAPGIAGMHWRDLDADIARLAEVEHVDTYVLLVEDRELADTQTSAIAEVCAAHGVELVRFPVVDHHAPADSTAYAGLLASIAERLRRGETVLVTCKGGLGRTGTAVACLLRDAGVGAEEAIAATRAARRGAIDAGAQEAFVRAWEPASSVPDAVGKTSSARPVTALDRVLAAYDAELAAVARGVVGEAVGIANDPRSRVFAAQGGAQDVWGRYAPKAAALGRVIEAGEGRARFFNALSDAAEVRWGKPPAPYASAVAWQRASKRVDPEQDTLILNWVVSELWREVEPGLPFPRYMGGGRTPLGRPRQGDLTARQSSSSAATPASTAGSTWRRRSRTGSSSRSTTSSRAR